MMQYRVMSVATDIDLSGIRNRIKRRMKDLDLTPAGVSRRGGRNQNAVRDLLSGKVQNPGISTLADIARALQMPIAELLGLERMVPDAAQPKEIDYLPLIGKIEDGAYRTHDFMAVANWEGFPTLPMLRHASFPHARQFALEVVSDCMASATPAILPGMYVCCIDLIQSGMSITNDMMVVVRHKRADLFEYTLRRAKVSPDRIDLLPESPTPKEAFRLPRDFDPADDNAKVQIVAMVYALHTPVLRL